MASRSGRPDAAQREAARQLDLHKRMREVEEAILARTPEHDLEPSLERIQAVMELLGDPQRTYPSIHITGTNGKTSTARIIESILRETGLKTGRFTSPHLHSIRERVSIAGEPISEEAFIRAYDEVIQNRIRKLPESSQAMFDWALATGRQLLAAGDDAFLTP